MILKGPGVDRKGEIYGGLVTVMDIAPSFYEAAGTEYPETYRNRIIYPLKGNSMMDFITGKTDHVHDEDYVFGLEHREKAMLRKGDWKIVHNDPPFRTDSFRLYKLSEDIAELTDLKEKNREKFAELISEWEKFSNEIKVRFPPPKP
jgi:arylsulfatase